MSSSSTNRSVFDLIERNILMTHRMFDTDVMRKRCTATVTACSPRKKGYGILLDQTVFFPS